MSLEDLFDLSLDELSNTILAIDNKFYSVQVKKIETSMMLEIDDITYIE